MQITANSADEYIQLLDEPRRSEIKKLHELIIKNAPKLKPTMVFGMLGYGTYHYKYASGREGDWVTLGLASQKNYISLYTTCMVDGKYLAEKYKLCLPKANIGKSCLRFTRLADVKIKVIEELVRESAKLHKDQVNT